MGELEGLLTFVPTSLSLSNTNKSEDMGAEKNYEKHEIEYQ